MEITASENETVNKISMAEKAYLFFATMALVMFYYAHAPWGVEKLFYVPCAGALVASFFCPTKHDEIDVILLLIIGFSLISDLVNFSIPNRVDAPWIRQCIGILCFNKLRKLNLNKVVSAMAYISPFIILSLYLFSSPFSTYRYGGFSGDPNYLAISLDLLIAINLIYIHRSDVPKVKCIIPIMTIIGILPLFLAGKSRAGIISLVVLLMCYLIFLFFRDRKACGIIIVLAIAFSGNIYLMFQKPIEQVAERFNNMEKMHGGARTAQFPAVFNVYRHYPISIPFGIGVDNSPLKYDEYKAKSPFAIHNTYLNILLQQGLFTLLLYIALFWRLIIRIRDYDNKLIYIGLFLSLLLNIGSVPSATYLTFWWSLFFLFNENKETAEMTPITDTYEKR